MANLLHIDSSPMGEASVSRQLSGTFVAHWKQANAGAHVVTRDLTTTSIEPVTAAWVHAAYTPEDKRSPELAAALKTSDMLLEELFGADEYVIGLPMYNFGIPAVLKLWIDQIARVGKTFAYVDGKPKGLLTGKKATFLIASGGGYDAGTAMAGYNFTDPYLKAVFGFLGVTDVLVHSAGGAAALNYGADRKEFLAPHEAAVAALVAKN